MNKPIQDKELAGMSLDAISSAARVLRLEGEALLTFAEALPEDFPKVVELILSCTGRVVMCGMGKSGHVATKIAATLASTGTPSFFVHPAEASHGDLGMITTEDVCILLSNSGETTELGDVLAHCARFGIPMVGISKNPDSTLMRAARFKLTLPNLPEACAIGMAPTTSTTLCMALGDALAVALMERRELSPEQFRTFHPGGKLGSRLATVARLMHSGEDIPTVSPETPMSEVIIEMSSRGFGVTAVVDAENNLVGAITDGDLRRNISGLLDQTAGAVATKKPVTIAPDMLAVEALALMNNLNISVIFVVKAGKLEGILHVHDCLRAGVA